MNIPPCNPEAEVALVMVGKVVAGLTVRVNVAGDPVPWELEAISVTLEVPVTVGVPEINPVAVSTVNPAGSPEALKLVGELLAVI